MRSIEEIESDRKSIGTPDINDFAKVGKNDGTMYELIAAVKMIEHDVSRISSNISTSLTGGVTVIFWILILLLAIVAAHVIHHW